MKWSSERKLITSGFGLVLLIIGIIAGISYQNAIQIAESAKRIKATNLVINNINNLAITLIESESGRRGYVLFNDQKELERYNNAIASLTSKIKQLRLTLTDIQSQEQRLNRLEFLINQEIKLFQQSIKQNRQISTPIPTKNPIFIKIKQNRTEIRQLTKNLQTEESRLLEIQILQSQSNLQSRMILEILGNILTVSILFVLYAMLYQQMHKKQIAETQKRALVQDKELSELKLQFFSMVSHEFRTPLSLIVGSGQLLEETLKPIVTREQLKNLCRIQSSAKIMTQLLSDILTVTRADAGKLEFSPTYLEIQTFCLNLVEDFQISSQPQQIIQFRKEGSSTHAWLDEKLIYSILCNLLSNAIKYSPEGSNIYFLLICEPDFISFKVKDSGIGIAEEDLEKLYHPFIRGKNVKHVLGTGLGLTVVKKCLDLHHGEIFVESEVGVGTTFTVTIDQKRYLSRITM
ncbi:MAG: CHASE3 domain-containing protein [Scytonematopsis contorta HA4267-MV1]|jgi:signal transduction histidine kinase|nr:CHASE3 domain-containing protein [Scytonematopsis contorta HA4267-MV1]